MDDDVRLIYKLQASLSNRNFRHQNENHKQKFCKFADRYLIEL